MARLNDQQIAELRKAHPATIMAPTVSILLDMAQSLNASEQVLAESWKQARETGEEFGISAEYLPALICGIGDAALNQIDDLEKERNALRRGLEKLIAAVSGTLQGYGILEAPLSTARALLQPVEPQTQQSPQSVD